MITQRGVNMLLFTFVSQGKENRRLTKLQIGKYTGNSFNVGLEVRLMDGEIDVVDFQTIEINKTISGANLPDGSVIEYNAINLLSENGDVFATRTLPIGAFSRDHRMRIEWRITMADMCWNSPSLPQWGNILGVPSATSTSIDSMVESSHTHSNLPELDKFREDTDANLYGDDGVVRIEWNKD